MVPVTSLLVPILLAAVIVFIASSVIHMVLPFHKHDLERLPKEAEVLDALRQFNLPPGDYAAPLPQSAADMKNPEFIARRTKGPVAFLTVLPSGPPSMGTSLALW